MMKRNISYLGGAIVALSIGIALPALAQNVQAQLQGEAAAKQTQKGANVTASTTVTLTAAESKQLARMKELGSKEIDRRIEALNRLNARMQMMKRLSAADKTALQGDVQTQLMVLAEFRTKMNANADLEAAKADRDALVGSYRIYALMVPKYQLVAAADRMATLTGTMATIGLKFQARVTAAQSAGADVTAATAALADLQAKLTDAKTKYTSALQMIAPLQPDNGDKTVMASNEKTLKDARALLKSAVDDFSAARKNIVTLRNWLKTAEVQTNTSATTTTTGGTQ